MNRACRKRPCRLRAVGPLAPYFEPYSEYLADRGYSQVSYWHKTFLINEFSRWLDDKGIGASEIGSEHEAAFLADSARFRDPKLGDPVTLSAVTSWLRDQGVIEEPATVATEISEIDRMMQEYSSYLHEDRGLAPATVENYCRNVRPFLADISRATGLSIDTLQAGKIADYIQRNAPKERTFVSAKHVVTALRSFFRFARYRDYIHADLAASVPSVAGWSMASIPRAMPADSVQILLTESKTWRTPAGLRNRAILLLLARLGLRAGEVARLELDDIDWRAGCLHIHGKGRTERPLPLPYDVGEAIAAYLENGRPASVCRRMFLCSRAPFGQFKGSSDVCVIVTRAIARAGIEGVRGGAHQLRHALAVGMLRQGASLTDIGQMLRHRSTETTRRYAKVDLDALREVALPWPEATP
ncbi:tyrosine-type recombinase/integrase [Agrobacterium vitis]|uniref:tyrosine-type recombinase/integrase n=1 Tax=Agrobacterium vitis TaxID=373 RepID=UPI001F2BBC9D|nr:tyrosine-type recombinase/integrase [Agrobacterium vitis]MCE6076388.1 tyrosine-type recombinase/integrase [Agrobacterium vitis]